MKLPLHIHLVVLLFGAILLFYVLNQTAALLIPLVFAGLLSLFLLPLCRKLEAWRFPKALAILTSLLLIMVVIGGVLSLISSNLLSFKADSPQMQIRAKELIILLQNTIAQKLNMSAEQQLVWLKQNVDGFVNMGGDVLNSLLNALSLFLSQLFIIPVYLFFILYYRHIFKGFINKILKEENLPKASLIEQQIQSVIQKYIVGLFTVISIIAVLNIFGLVLLGVKHALFFGLLAAFLTIIPYIGIFIGAALPVLYALVMYDSLYMPVAVLGWFVLIQVLEGNLITPNVVGSQVSINPLVAMLALLVGGNVWGIAGMIMFVPLTAMLKVVLDNVPTLEPYGYLLGEGNPPPIAPQGSFWIKIMSFFKKK